MKMDNSDLPRFNKCCFLFALKSGVLLFVSIEALFWALISFVAVYSEVKYINSIDLLDFTDDLERDWYYFLIFEHPRDTFNEKVRSESQLHRKIVVFCLQTLIYYAANLIVLNLVLSFIFVLYLVFTLLLLVGISKVSSSCGSLVINTFACHSREYFDSDN